MLQNFLNSYVIFKNSKNKVIVIVLMASISLLILLLKDQTLRSNKELEDKILSNIFDFSSVFSGLLIAFIIGKVFQLRNENIVRKEKINQISNKITHLRRICKILLNNWEIWDIGLKDALNKHKKLTYFDFYLHHLVKPHPASSKSVSDFFNDKTIKSEIASKFYLAVKDLELKRDFNLIGGGLKLYDDYDWNIDYPLDLLDLWTHSNCAGQFWYCLIQNKDVAKKYFFLGRLGLDGRNRILALCEKIDPKYRSRELNNELLSDIGTDFDQYYFPEILFLTRLNSSANRSIRFITDVLAVLILSGVLIPLILLSFDFQFNVKRFFTYLCVFLTALSLVWFITKIKSILTNELTVE